MKHPRILRGFTVVELAVVIVVIVVLTTLASVGYGSIQREQRDVQRDEAVGVMMHALEKYYDENGEYPYGLDFNPTRNQTKIPDYTAIKTILPSLTDGILNAGGNNFMAHTCSSTAVCTYTLTTAYNSIRPAQFTYISNVVNTTANNISHAALWGCSITTNNSDPGVVIVWYEEAVKQWHFVRSKHGTITIANYSSGPTAPTTCALEYAA